MDCVTASNVNMFINKVDTYLRRAGYTYINIVGLSISQWLPCPLAIWAFGLGGTFKKNLVKLSDNYLGKFVCHTGQAYSITGLVTYT